MRLQGISCSLLFAIHLLHPMTPVDAFNKNISSANLRASFPDLQSNRTGDPLILCPFLRMLERSGRLDNVLDDRGQSIEKKDLKSATQDFGCDSRTACGPMVDAVSAAQCSPTTGFPVLPANLRGNPRNRAVVELERLWDAPPISHRGCGFAFDKGAAQYGVSVGRLDSTMFQLSKLADENGRLNYQDILDTKKEVCEEDGVEVSAPGIVQTQLLFGYLGGVERGFVDYSDVERFLAVDSQMPHTKANKPITALYLMQLRRQWGPIHPCHRR